jgi:hypothetical protein
MIDKRDRFTLGGSTIHSVLVGEGCETPFTLEFLSPAPLIPYRHHECRKNHEWDAPVWFPDTTTKLSGEATQYCPKCGGRSAFASPWFFADEGPRTPSLFTTRAAEQDRNPTPDPEPDPLLVALGEVLKFSITCCSGLDDDEFQPKFDKLRELYKARSPLP